MFWTFYPCYLLSNYCYKCIIFNYDFKKIRIKNSLQTIWKSIIFIWNVLKLHSRKGLFGGWGRVNIFYNVWFLYSILYESIVYRGSSLCCDYFLIALRDRRLDFWLFSTVAGEMCRASSLITRIWALYHCCNVISDNRQKYYKMC